MTYHWELATGHQISVVNQGVQTVVTTLQTSAGGQQQSSHSFTTGIWIAPPVMTLTPTGGTIEIATATGTSIIQIQGNSIHLQSSHGSADRSTTSNSTSASFSANVEPMPPLPPLPPLQMGNMQMNMQPMTMRMGDMELKMGKPASQQRFCTECGLAVKPTDKFCAGCGHKLASTNS